MRLLDYWPGGPTLSDTGKQIVIVVDDDPQIRESLASFLQSVEFRCMDFPSAETVLESPFLSQASCVITDVYMEGMNGLVLQQRLKHDYPRLPVIILSGHADERMSEVALASGAVVLLTKPFDPDDLLSTIYTAIESANEEAQQPIPPEKIDPHKKPKVP
jgi:FixJ family two-component response regulator